MFPNITDHTLLHPTPLYESIVAIGIFILLWKLRKKPWADGRLFALFLILNGTARFLVEFIRLNPRILWGLSEAQVIGAMIAGTGLILTFYLKANSDKYHYQPPKPVPEKTESSSKKKKGKKER
jgi:phosphatidylglycerol:prolipoprotein diacylglycerol transferase